MPDHVCPRCQSPIPASDDVGPGGPQCPRCLLRPPWDKPQPIAITLGPGLNFLPPTVEELRQHLVGYEVEALIGQGGMGAVYLGRQLSLDRPVAIKILPEQIAQRAGFRERFAQEGRALAKLNHPNIVSVHDFGQAGPYAMLVMELVQGANLREVLAQGRLAPEEALEIIPQLCDALSYAHDEGVVHRDIKPENLLFDGRGRLKITDFGLAKLLSNKTAASSDTETSVSENQESTRDGERHVPDPTQGIVGTLHYMAPEQLENPRTVDHRADIYALGVVFYEMLTGELPIGRFEPPSQLVAEDQAETPGRVTIDVRLDEVVLRALEKHPEKRYGSASAIMQDIDDLEKQPHRAAGPAGHGESPQERVKQSVHRAGEAAGRLAAASLETTGDWVNETRHRFWKNPAVDGPATWSVVVLVLSAVFGGLLSMSGSDGEALGLFALFIGSIVAFILARLSLRREAQFRAVRADLAGGDDVPPNFASRSVLGILYLAVAVPVIIAPFIAAFGLWAEIYDFPRDVGRLGWLRDWLQSIAVAVIATSCCWLALLVFHLIFPKFFSTLFRPFVRPFNRTAGFASALLLITLAGIGWVAILQMPYLAYSPGMTVAEGDWEKLSPRDLKEMQNELREADMLRREAEAPRE